MELLVKNAHPSNGKAIRFADVLDYPWPSEGRTTDLGILSFIHSAMRFKSPYLHDASVTAQELAIRICGCLGMGPDQAEVFGVAVSLSDVGVLVSTETVSSTAIHAELGAMLLAQLHRPLFILAADAARAHHEHYDGTGFPNGMAGEEIPLVARVAAVSLFVGKRLSRTSSQADARCIEACLSALEGVRRGVFDPQIVTAAKCLVGQESS